MSTADLIIRGGKVVSADCVIDASVAIDDGPIYRRLGLGAVKVHTVAGPITPSIGALERADAEQLFDTVAAAAVRSGLNDTTHHWRANETAARKQAAVENDL